MEASVKARIEQIDMRWNGNAPFPSLIETARKDIRELLSLVKSQEAVSVHAAAEAATQRLCKFREVIAGSLDLRVPKQREGFQIWLEDAMKGVATSMRSACIEKVRPILRDYELEFRRKTNSQTNIVDYVVMALESVSIQEQE